MYRIVQVVDIFVPEVFMYAVVVEEKLSKELSKETRITFPDHINSKWKALVSRKSIGQQRAIERLIEFILKQDDALQSMILGQIEPSDDLVELVLRRLKVKNRPAKSQSLGKPVASVRASGSKLSG